ncbi:hypothetical protein SAMN05216266_105308 [Amycolatopsis marina]|uniref:Uncharacterized protein n=1 Tax=Amycolatopsis marina TaxID=490629 RepID=A0A1I0YT66_9PSEU|nr:hypothetical protein [Amycolatopsis marina]SFB16401.1 hypothetical protein SAMN05216266_105308 [Amycolatopsis marina]
MAARVPSLIPGVVDRHILHVLQPRWARARSYLLVALAGVPLLILLSSALLVAVAAAHEFAWWLVLPLLGSALPALVLAARLSTLTLEPHRWLKAAFLTAGCQLLIGGIPAVGMAVNAGSGGASAAATVAFLAQWALLVLGCVFAYRASRVLLVPVCPELAATPFTVAFRARLPNIGDGLLSGSARVARDRVEWSARRHKGRGGPTAEGQFTFEHVRAVRVSALPPATQHIPWLRLSDGSTMYTSPGPAVILSTDAGECMLPIADAGLFADLLNRRIAAWRGGPAR